MIYILKKNNFFKKNPVRTICFSFLIIMMLGSFLLRLPISSKNPVSFTDCLFTSTSATCITGFSVKDTFSQWSLFGKIVILILIQTGGLGFITFSSVFLIILNNKLSLKNLKLASSQINVKNLADVKTLFKNVLLITFFCEFVGTILLSFSYCKKFGSYGIFMSVFSAVAAYCNAGLDLNGIFYENCSFIPFSKDYLVVFTISALTFVGGIGFVAINEILQFKKAKIKLRCISISSKIAVFGSLFMLIFGTIGFLFLEYGNSLKDFSFLEKISNSVFNSTAARTSGFTTVDFSQIDNLTKLFLCILMFIGANPTGTSGGIKISTIIIILSTVVSVLKNKEENTILDHKINKTTTYKAIALFFLSLLIIFLSILLVSSFNSEIALSNVVFSVVSAFSTTGFQIINSNCFSTYSKYILIALMFIGRVGPLSFAIIFNNKNNSKHMFLPESNLNI